MIRKELLNYTVPALKKRYSRYLPVLSALALQHHTPESFKENLCLYVSPYADRENDDVTTKAASCVLQLIAQDHTVVDELSTGQQLRIRTITYLWEFLNGKLTDEVSPDLFLDLFHLFYSLDHPVVFKPDQVLARKQMSRWPSGQDPGVIAIRSVNKRRIIDLLIHKIERRRTPVSKYLFAEDMSAEEKQQQVETWWGSYRFHLAMALKSPQELNVFLGNTLSDGIMQILNYARKKGMPFFVTPYYLSLLNTGSNGYDDAAIRSYIIYSEELVNAYGEIKAWEKEDIVEAGKPNAAGWLLPEGHNIHRRYPEVSILIPDSMGRACGGLCASCQRMYDFQSERLNFDLEALKPKETWDQKLRRLMTYFEEDSQLRDILITGGDALMSQDATLRKILDAIYRMAIRKRRANEGRPDGEKYAEIQRVRLGSRLLAYLPVRVTPDLVEILREFKEKASTVGIRQFYIQTHFQSPLEITPEARLAVERILSAGWIITNQMVYTVAVSRRGHATRLRQALNAIGVVCYYTFSVKGFNENYAVFTPNSRSVQEETEEKIWGRIPIDKRDELHTLMQQPALLPDSLQQFLKANQLLFAATDRNVLNLPGIGKSMTFKTIGITAEGKRILCFDHDKSRRHSPIIDRIGKVCIVENKSIAAYLRQLQEMKEDLNDYRSIWYYCEGKTEPRFSLYEYPDFSFAITEKMTNLQLDI